MDKTRIVIMMLIIAAVAFWAGGQFGKKEPRSLGDKGKRTVLYYTDPMNPGFRTDKPGIAPCGMPLEPVYADAGDVQDGSLPGLSHGAVTITPDRQQLIGVKVSPVELQPMTYMLRLYGKVVADETRVFRVNASTDSWIRELSDVTTGSIVRKDQLLAEALAPAYYNAQVTYLLALDNMDRIKQQMGGQLRHQQGDLANNQIRMAVQALQNLGIGDAQVEELANTRQARPYLQVRAPSDGVVLRRDISRNQWFKAAEEFYTIADISRVWIYADVYENEARHLFPGMAVRVRHAQLGKTFDATVSEVLPLFDPLSKTLKVRLDVSNPRYNLRPDMFVDIEIPLTLPPALSVPSDAVIDSGTKTLLYVESGEGVFVPREITTGWRLGRQIEIIGGLMAGERVVVSGNFLIDSESRMKTAAAGGGSGKDVDPVCGMEVDRDRAERSEMVARTKGRSYYFCSRQCKDLFLKQPQEFAGKTRGRAEFATSKDPVCGMNVHREIAENSGRSMTYAGHTFFFCSHECLQSFKNAPGTYAGKGQPVADQAAGAANAGSRRGRESAGWSVPQTGWDRAASKAESPAKPDRSAYSPGVIDWNGPEAERNGTQAQDWKGWGKFPGAEYLGLKDRTKKTAGTQPDASGFGDEKTADGPQDRNSQEREGDLNRTGDAGRTPDARGTRTDQ